jgi:YD repeat-containing protein
MAAGCWVRRLGCAVASSLSLASLLAASAAHAQATCPTSSGATAYAYDALGRLTGVCNTANGVQATYTYDAAGNRTAQSVGVKPAPKPVTVTIKENTATSIAFSIAGGAATSTAVATGPSHGSVGTPSATAVTYTPTTGYTGPDSFTYTATNSSGTSPYAAPVTITVLAPPIAGAVSADIGENSTGSFITLNLSGGQATSVANATSPSHGAATVSGMTISYKPTANYTGADSFTYTATNVVGTSAPATISITVASTYGVWGAFNWGAKQW